MVRNGKVRKKHGRPKADKAVSKKLIKTEAIKADGSPTKMAKALGISPQSAAQHLQKPDVQNAVLTARAAAIKGASLTRLKAYKQLANQMSAKKAGEVIVRGKTKPTMVADWPAQNEARKNYLKIIGDYEDDTPTDGDGKVVPFLILLPERNVDPHEKCY